MIEYEEVEHLAKLARIDMSEDEKKELQKDLESILNYATIIEEITDSVQKELPNHRNIMREDIAPHESGEFTKEIVDLFPDKKGDYLRVKKIIN